ncbi:VOC family protein [Rhodobacterales bacterium HKCCSP123]|nr:VOC family protein [Rhodobacterales bacterium HKCCSP123]
MTFTPALPVAWTEIPVGDLDAGTAFYEAVTGCRLERQSMGPNDTAVFVTDPPMGAGGVHLYPGKPAPGGVGPTVHLAIADRLEDAIARVVPAGGAVVSPPIAIPAGRFAYITDPDGNSIGLFEAAEG